MFQDTRPAQLSGDGSTDAWAEFRVDHPGEVAALMRQIRDSNVPVSLNSPGGAMLATSLWAMDDQRRRLNFSADTSQPQLEQLVEGDEVVAVAYLDSVKLQFDLHGLLLVRSARASALQAEMPNEVYRFQRRGAFFGFENLMAKILQKCRRGRAHAVMIIHQQDLQRLRVAVRDTRFDRLCR